MQTNNSTAAGGAETLPINPETRNQPSNADLNQTTTPVLPIPGLSIDDIALFRDTKIWMRRHSIMPSSWKLSDDETNRIVLAGLRISVYNTPASCLPLAESFAKGLTHLIVVDPSQLDSGKFTPKQMIATLLHEIGHVVNPPIKGIFDYDYMMQLKGVKEDEVFADDYARRCGYGPDFADALERMKQAEPNSFDNDAVKYRMERIRADGQVYLNLLPLVEEPN